MESLETTRKRAWLSPGKTALLITFCLCAMLAAWGYNKWRAANEVPNIVVPTPKLPSPNAFDFYVKAGNAVQDDMKIGWAIAKAPPRLPPGVPNVYVYTLAQKEALVKENAGTLKMLRQGFAYPYWNPPVRSNDTPTSYYAGFRHLAQLLALEGQIKAAHGDWGGTVNSDLDALQIGIEIPHGSPLMGELNGNACQSTGRKPIWKAVDHLNVTQARQMARRLESLQADRVALADTLQEEKWAQQAWLLQIFHQSNWRSVLYNAVLYNPSDQEDQSKVDFKRLAQNMRLTIVSKATVLNNFTRYLDQMITNARRPYAAKLPPPPPPDDPFSPLMAPYFSPARLGDAKNQTQNALLLVTLALRAYRLEHGVYPIALAALVPTYLKRLPDDPFALQSPLHYRLTGQKYVLYSVGPDGKDDGGKPIDDPSKIPQGMPLNSPSRYSVREGSVGDIVAGFNRQ